MDNRKVTKTFIIASTLLIIIVLSFTGGLNIASFKENYTESLVSSYAVGGGKSVRNIEYAVKYGKPLDNFLGIEKMLQNVVEETSSIDEANITLPNGRIIYNQFGKVENESLSDSLISQLTFHSEARHNERYLYLLHEENYYVFLPIYDRSEQWIGSLTLVFSQNVITSHTDTYMWKLIFYLSILAVISFVCLLIFSMKVSILTDDGTVSKKRVLSSLIVIIGIVQIVYGLINYQMFNKAYLEIADSNTAHIANVIEKDIHSVIDKGVAYENLYKIEDYLQTIIQSVPIIDNILISNQNGQIIYTTLDSEMRLEEIEPKYVYSASLHEDIAASTANLQVIVSKEYIAAKMKNIILDTGTILITSFLFMVELTLFILIYLGRQLNVGKASFANATDQEITIIRPLAFLLFFGIFMSVSFIPIVMSRLYEPMFGLSKNVILGLPLSVEMLFGGASTILAGYLIDRRDWKLTFYLGLTIVAIGTLLSGFATGAFNFIFARGVVGAGYGFSLMALRAFVNTSATENVRTAGLSSLFAGIYAGLNCGVIVGAMLADRIGYANVFFVAFSMMVLTGIFALMYLQKGERKTVATVQKSEKTAINLFQFFTHKKVFGLFLFVIIPTAISGMFLDYYFPLFAEEVGLSSSNVGRAFLLNGLCIVYLGPFLSKYFSKRLGDFKTVLLGGLLIAIGMLYFSWQGTVLAAIVTIILLGLSDSFGLVAQNNYFVKLSASRELGIGKALGYFDNIRKTGQMVGPMIFGYLVTMGFFGIGVLGVTFLTMLVVFLMIGRNRASKGLSN